MDPIIGREEPRRNNRLLSLPRLRQFWRFYWPIFDSFCEGCIRDVDTSLAKKNRKLGSKEPQNRQKLGCTRSLMLIFKKNICDHHRIIVERDDKSSVLTPAEFEAAFGLVYLPRIEFAHWKDFVAISRKIGKFCNKGMLDQKQLALGDYFKKEIQEPTVPPVRLRWIDETFGWGVFAEQDLKPMDYIGEYGGIVRRKKKSDLKNAYCFEYSIVKEVYTHYAIDALNHGAITRFINHSLTPNLMSDLAVYQNLSHTIFYVSRLIKKGEQLCINYGPDYWKIRTPPQEFKN